MIGTYPVPRSCEASRCYPATARKKTGPRTPQAQANSTERLMSDAASWPTVPAAWRLVCDETAMVGRRPWTSDPGRGDDVCAADAAAAASCGVTSATAGAQARQYRSQRCADAGTLDAACAR